MIKQEIHNTSRELEYLAFIGTEHLNTRKIPRYKMIELYLDAAMKRVNWDGIDKDKVINAARRML